MTGKSLARLISARGGIVEASTTETRDRVTGAVGWRNTYTFADGSKRTFSAREDRLLSAYYARLQRPE